MRQIWGGRYRNANAVVVRKRFLNYVSANGFVCASAEEAEGKGTRVEMYLCMYVRQRNRFTLCTGQCKLAVTLKMRSTNTFCTLMVKLCTMCTYRFKMENNNAKRESKILLRPCS
jgi:hypothetical protein